MTELADRPIRVPGESLSRHWLRILRWLMNLRMVPRWREHAEKPLTRLYKRLFWDGLTRTGKTLLICSVLIFLFSYRRDSDFTLTAGAFGIALVGWSLILGFAHRPRVRLEPDTPEYGIAGQPLISQLRVTNESRLSMYNFTLREMVVPYCRWPREPARPHRMMLAPGQQTTVAVTCLPQRRGMLELTGVAVQSYFPFFLTRFTQRLKQHRKVMILPPTLDAVIPSLRHVAEQASKRMKLGTDNTRKGPSLEYAYSRQYQTGDSLRRLDHRAGSRIGEPMSKVFEGTEEIRRDKVYLMVDTTLRDFEPWQPRPASEAALDRRLALAVELGLSAQNEGFTLTGVAVGNEWHKVDTILDLYRQVAECRPTRAVDTTRRPLPDRVMAHDGLHLLVIGRWTDAARGLVENWQRDGIMVLVFLLAESQQDTGALPAGNPYYEIHSPGITGK